MTLITPIKKVAVLGAGTMGAGIAAQVANAGVPVVLLDIVPPGLEPEQMRDPARRNAIAEGAVARLLKADPAAFMHKKAARLVTTGNLEDHLPLLAECDWIIEAVIEKLEVKRDLYRRIDAVRKPGSVVSSNTSTIPLALLIDGQTPAFAADFCITHFFNPPRYMRLLELVGGPATRAEALAAVRSFADHALGKSVVDAKDTPGFIANRIGIYWLQAAVVEAITGGLTVEEADSVIGRPMGIPKTGVFGLLDLVGIDIMPHVMSSMLATVPADDPLRALIHDDSLIRQMIAEGLTGRKGKGGFYRINKSGGGKAKEAIDLASGRYRPQMRAGLESVEAAKAAGKQGLRALVAHPDRGGAYGWKVLSGTLCYALDLATTLADSIAAIDDGLRLGYNWKFGPFELLDQMGPAWFAARLQAEGRPLPALLAALLATGDAASFYRVDDGQLRQFGFDGAYHPVARPDGVLLLADLKRNRKPLARTGSAALWDIDDGVACLEFTGKMNALDPDVMALIRQAITLLPERGFKALVVYNEGSNFSVGANLGLALFAANAAMWREIETLVQAGQETYKALRDAPFPVVGAPSGMALGGGCEILLHCDAVQAHAETYMGLVEVGVGLIPAWGGCKEMLRRWQAAQQMPGSPMPKGPMPAVGKVFEIVSTATVAKSAAEAKELLYLRPDDGVTMNRDRLLADAKARALALAARGYQPPAPPVFSLPGPSAMAAMGLAVDSFRKLGKATPHDVVVSTHLAAVLAGGESSDSLAPPLDEDALLALERQHFMTLVKHPDTRARVEHMLETGKPLRN